MHSVRCQPTRWAHLLCIRTPLLLMYGLCFVEVPFRDHCFFGLNCCSIWLNLFLSVLIICCFFFTFLWSTGTCWRHLSAAALFFLAGSQKKTKPSTVGHVDQLESADSTNWHEQKVRVSQRVHLSQWWMFSHYLNCLAWWCWFVLVPVSFIVSILLY